MVRLSAVFTSLKLPHFLHRVSYLTFHFWCNWTGLYNGVTADQQGLLFMINDFFVPPADKKNPHWIVTTLGDKGSQFPPHKTEVYFNFKTACSFTPFGFPEKRCAKIFAPVVSFHRTLNHNSLRQQADAQPCHPELQQYLSIPCQQLKRFRRWMEWNEHEPIQ